MKEKIKNYIKTQSFQPNWTSPFINPFLFIRMGLFKKIKAFAPQLKGSVLDFGCGRKPYRNLFINASDYIGLDMEVSGHDHTHSTVDVYYDGKKIPFKDEYFDNIFSSEVFEHIENIEDILKELNRVLKKGGKILITVPFVWNEHEVPNDYRRFTTFGIISMLKKHNFKIDKVETTTHFFETLYQTFILYLYHIFQTKKKALNTLLTLIFLSPFNLLGLILVNIVPRNKSLYHNVIVLAEKEA